MSSQLILDPIDSYIREVSRLLPYEQTKKEALLIELKNDVKDAMDSDKRPPSVVFGPPRLVAKNLSVSQDWNTNSVGMIKRTLAFLLDYLLIIVVFTIFALLRIILTDFSLNEIEFQHDTIPLGFLMSTVPMIIFMFSYFVLSELTFSTTFGKKILNLIVIDESGIKITWQQAIIRNVTKVPFISTFLPFDVLLGVLSEKTLGDKQRVLDLAAGTLVVQLNNE